MNSEEALKRIKDDIEINYLTTKHNNEKENSLFCNTCRVYVVG